jgi:hypothetical protein
VTTVRDLAPQERIIIDTRHLDVLFQRLGDRDAEALVMDRVEQITDRLAEVEWQYRHGKLSEIVPRARAVSALSSEIGLTSLARVARDLSIAAAASDMIAFRAIWERLVRIGDRSLCSVWELPGLSL